MGDDSMDPLLRASSEAERFAIVADDVEHLIWRYVLSPSSLQGVPGLPKIQEVGAVVEIMPNVYAHSVRLVLDKHPHYFMRVWGLIHHPDGTVEESPLFVARSDDFPDESLAQFKVGMNTNLLWYDEIKRVFLAALEARRKARQLPSGGAGTVAYAPAPGQAPESASGWVPAAEVQQLLAHGDMAALTRFIERHTQGGIPAVRGATGGPQRASIAATDAPSPASNGHQAAATDTTALADLRRQTQGLFDEWKQLRETAYKERDTLDRKLKTLYFSLYPFMRDAARYTNAFDLDAALTAWMLEGCPPPKDEMPASLPPGVTVDVLPYDETRAKQLIATSEEARRLAVEYDRAKAQVRERSRVLERICEIAGGHSPRAERDEAGAPLTICARCGARLNQRATDRKDSWLE